MDVKLAVAQVLRSIRVCPKYRGHGYLLFILTQAVEDRRCLHNFSALIYPQVAAHFGVSRAQIERSLRFVIQQTWEKDTTGCLHELFAVYGIDYVPTNREFISILTEYILFGPLPQAAQLRQLS